MIHSAPDRRRPNFRPRHDGPDRDEHRKRARGTVGEDAVWHRTPNGTSHTSCIRPRRGDMGSINTPISGVTPFLPVCSFLRSLGRRNIGRTQMLRSTLTSKTNSIVRGMSLQKQHTQWLQSKCQSNRALPSYSCTEDCNIWGELHTCN